MTTSDVWLVTVVAVSSYDVTASAFLAFFGMLASGADC